MLSVVQLVQPGPSGLATVVEAAGQTIAPSQIDAIRLAVVEAQEHPSDSESTATTFSNRLFVSLAQHLGPEIWVPILVAVVLALMAPAWDYYIKDLLGKASQQEDRRAMAREIAKAMAEHAVPPIFIQNRGVALKALSVHLNARSLSPVIGRLRQGEIVHIEGMSADWVQVTWRSADGREMSGWVFRRYVRLLTR
jgi:hypothetical protein